MAEYKGKYILQSNGNYDVDLYEKEKTILCGASRANQMRFHLGYHYPRSLKTLKFVFDRNNHLTERMLVPDPIVNFKVI